MIKSDDKKRARVNCMRDLLYRLPYDGKDEQLITEPDPLIVGRAAAFFPHMKLGTDI